MWEKTDLRIWRARGIAYWKDFAIYAKVEIGCNKGRSNKWTFFCCPFTEAPGRTIFLFWTRCSIALEGNSVSPSRQSSQYRWGFKGPSHCQWDRVECCISAWRCTPPEVRWAFTVGLQCSAHQRQGQGRASSLYREWSMCEDHTHINTRLCLCVLSV